ncbi:MAG TPA: ATP synthase F0 subunit B [Thermoanaerobaculia bacterium]|nr:ATP synthase F0 subunit B [Thermoanaerobaculia bacterium]
MRKLLLILTLAFAPALFAETTPAEAAGAPHDTTGASAAHGAEGEAHKVAHPDEHGAAAAEHHEKTYFGIPGWILKIANMVLFIGVLVYFIGGPAKKAFAERGEAIRRANQEARERSARAEQMAGEIQARLTAIEAEVRAIHERAQSEGERQKRELMTAAETETQKILNTARNEVDNRLKHARVELTEFAGQLASQRAEQILREKINDQDQKKLFQESLREVSEVRS